MVEVMSEPKAGSGTVCILRTETSCPPSLSLYDFSKRRISGDARKFVCCFIGHIRDGTGIDRLVLVMPASDPDMVDGFCKLSAKGDELLDLIEITLWNFLPTSSFDTKSLVTCEGADGRLGNG